MTYTTNFFTCLLLLCCSTYTFGNVAEPEPLVPIVELGFTDALVDAATLQQLLSNANCDAVRIYNVMASARAAAGTVMLVGVDRSGKDINGGLFAKPYKMSAGVTDGSIMTTGLSRSAAEAACDHAVAASHTSISASFSRADVQTALNTARCNSIRVVPAAVAGTTTMKIVPAAFDAGNVTDLQGELICAEPCPTVCGPPGNYINQR